ncbi:IS110 family transposase [Thomasclavelia ramosa]|nr:IS110 family transposase [Thomasclavelia ramosa]
MYYVGIDIAKYKHDCFIFTSEGEIVLESFTFENTREGFSKLKLILDALDHSQKIKIGLEATGIYGKNLKLFLSSIGYDFDELNPLQVKRFTNALSNRKTKTDKIDASQIARFVSTGASRTYVYSSYHTEALK